MYLSHFGLQRRPFPSAPDTACYYPATCHEQALARIQQALSDGEAMVLLTGDAGTGKTLLCHCLLERHYQEASTAFLTNSHIGTRKDLLQAVLFDLSLPYQEGTEQELRLKLTDYLLQNYALGRKTLFIVDEAHYLSVDALEELRLLCNLEADAGSALHVVLVAQPSFRNTLSRPQLASLRQRLAVRTSLNYLGLEESIDYLLHHLRAAGGRPENIISEEALELIGRAAGGAPRMLDQAGRQALAFAQQTQVDFVDAEVALETISSLGLELREPVNEVPVTAPSISETPGNDNGKKLHLLEDQEDQDTSKGPTGEEAEQSPTEEADEKVLEYRLYEPPSRLA